jgi:hypothetical protein
VRGWGRRLVVGSPETIAGTVYGTIVVMAALAAGARSFGDDLWRFAAIVVSTALVFWVAHVYAHGLAESIARRGRLGVSGLVDIARRELSIALAVVLPTSALVLGALDVLDDAAAVWLALAVGVTTLAIQGFRYADAEQLGPTGTALAVAVNLALGLSMIAVKVVLAH